MDFLLDEDIEPLLHDGRTSGSTENPDVDTHMEASLYDMDNVFFDHTLLEMFLCGGGEINAEEPSVVSDLSMRSVSENIVGARRPPKAMKYGPRMPVDGNDAQEGISFQPEKRAHISGNCDNTANIQYPQMEECHQQHEGGLLGNESVSTLESHLNDIGVPPIHCGTEGLCPGKIFVNQSDQRNGTVTQGSISSIVGCIEPNALCSTTDVTEKVAVVSTANSDTSQNRISPRKAAMHATSSSRESTSGDEEETREQLIARFSSLAHKLGMDLPHHVLHAMSAATKSEGNPTKGLSLNGTPKADLEIDPLTIFPNDDDAESKKFASENSMAEYPFLDNTQEKNTKDKPISPGGNSPDDSSEVGTEPSLSPAPAEPPSSSEPTPTSSSTQSAATNKSRTKSNNATRKRKRTGANEVEAKLLAVKEENRLLKLKLETLNKKTERINGERAEAERAMRVMVQSGNWTDEQLMEVFAQFREMYSDFGRGRESELNFHLNEVKSLCTPSNVSKMTIYCNSQTPEFWSNPKKHSLGSIMGKDLQLTQAQIKTLTSHRSKMIGLGRKLNHIMKLFFKLRTLCAQKHKIFSARLAKCQEILTPYQNIKLLMWVDDNSYLYERVCPVLESRMKKPSHQ